MFTISSFIYTLVHLFISYPIWYPLYSLHSIIYSYYIHLSFLSIIHTYIHTQANKQTQTQRYYFHISFVLSHTLLTHPSTPRPLSQMEWEEVLRLSSVFQFVSYFLSHDYFLRYDCILLMEQLSFYLQYRFCRSNHHLSFFSVWRWMERDCLDWDCFAKSVVIRMWIKTKTNIITTHFSHSIFHHTFVYTFFLSLDSNFFFIAHTNNIYLSDHSFKCTQNMFLTLDLVS